jgi:hypothetical protein
VRQKNNDRPLVLHTHPAPRQVPETSEATVTSDQVPLHKETRLSPCTATVPRLISVAEIIKREYVKALAAKRSSRLSGLHQYNEICCLEDAGLLQAISEEDRGPALALALEGKNQLVAFCK